MKTRMIVLAIILGVILSILIPFAIPPVVLAQTVCRNALGVVIPCPEEQNKKKTATPPRPTRTPTPTSTLTPSVTPVASLTPTAVLPLPIIPGGDEPPQPSGFPGGFGWLFGFLVPAVLVLVGWFFLGQKRKDGGQGKASPSDFNFTHFFDKASPQMKPGSDQGFDTDMLPGEDGGTSLNSNDGGTTLNNNDGGPSMTNNE